MNMKDRKSNRVDLITFFLCYILRQYYFHDGFSYVEVRVSVLKDDISNFKFE